VSARVQLRPPTPEDQAEFLEAVRASRTLHHPWTSPPGTAEQFRAYLARVDQPEHRNFLVCRRGDGRIAGMVNVSNIVRGLFCSAYLGYCVFSGHERQGLMREGVQAVVRQAFGPMRLHRLEANIQPGNEASIALAAVCGFAKEGYSPRYLKIGGRWRDHERWAVLAS